jgi:ketosteroid isomerase-like protein
MSDENIEIVRRIYDDYVDRPETVRDLFAPDVVHDASDTAPDVGVVRGIDAFDESLRTYFDSFDAFQVEIEEVIHADERIVILAVIDVGRLRGSTAEVRNHRFHVWTLSDGKAIRLSSHLEKGQAFKAAGLSE